MDTAQIGGIILLVVSGTCLGCALLMVLEDMFQGGFDRWK